MSRAEFIAYTWFPERAHPNLGTWVSVAIPTRHIIVHIDFLAGSAHTLTLVFKLDGLGRIVAILLDVDNL